MIITEKTTIREIASNKQVLAVINGVSGGLFSNPAIMQADSMPLSRIAAFLPGNGSAMMQAIIDKANGILAEMNIFYETDAVQDEIDSSVGLETTDEKIIEKRTSIKPGQVWRDTDGNRIQAHGGTMFTENGKYYWIGENKDHTMGTGNIWTWGIKIYSSSDLYNWTDEGYLVKPELNDKSSLFYPSRRLDRPHLIYNSRTGKYVLWIKFIDEAHFSVLTSDRLMGEYELVRRELRPYGANCGDFDLAVDEATGDGYIYFEANHTDMWAAMLSDDYTDVSGDKEIIYQDVPVPFTREGLAHVMNDGKHYLFSSGMTGYIPNPSEVAVSDDWIKGYTVIGDPHVGDESCASFNSQISNIFKVIGQDKYVVMADRWVPELKVTAEIYERIVRVIRSRQDSSVTVSEDDKAFFASLPMIGTAKTAIADYVWLPLDFDGDRPVIRWVDEWRTDDGDMVNTKDLAHFKKEHDYVICVDSDGTVMDAMNVKHKKCFGPCFVEVFGLDGMRDEVLASWNKVNLHGETRARNRFITALIMLKKYNDVLHFDLSAYENWVNTSASLSNGALEKEIERTGDEVMKKVLHWSIRSNEEISKLTFDDKKPFTGAEEFFESVGGKIDIAVVSSAGIGALMEEWMHFGLYDLVTVLTSQEDGTKAECIEKIKACGYPADHVIMMGDAIVDYEAALKCGIYFYPVIPEKETESWSDLKDKYCAVFTDGRYGSVQDGLTEKFRNA